MMIMMPANAQAGQEAAPGPPPATAAPVAGSASQLDEIIVTAQRRSENIQKVPVAVTAFSGETLTARASTNIIDLAPLTPGLQLSNANGTLVPFLRGIGDSANPIGNEASVAVYVDGVFYSRLPIGFFSLANVERVEVLKGPQGTLFGRNSSGGVIQILTPDPSHDAQLRGHLGYGSFDTFRGDLYATAGLGAKIAMDFSVSGMRQGDGYGRNVTTDTRANYQDDYTARSKLLFEPTEATKIVVSGFYSHERVGALGNTYPGTTQGFLTMPFTQQPRESYYDQHSDFRDNYNTASAWGASLRLQQELGFGTFTSITGYLHDEEFQRIDSDYTPRPDDKADVSGRVRQFTQEFQLASQSGSDLSWIAGLFYYNSLNAYRPLNLQGAAFFPQDVLGDAVVNEIEIFGRRRAKSYAGYAQATYEILPRLRLTGGIRYTQDRTHGSGYTNISIANGMVFIPGAVTRASDKSNKITFKAAADYRFTPDILAYASFSRGYKSATYNLLPFSGAIVKPELIDAYEVGLKSELLDRRLRINAAVFQYNVGNPQVQLLTNGNITLSNAKSSRVRGAEFDGAVVAAPGLSFTFGATYLDAKFTSYGTIDPATGACIACAPSSPPTFSPPFGTLPNIAIVATGNRTPLAPKFTASIGAAYTFETSIGKWNVAADYNYNSGFFWEPDNFLHENAYHIVNGRVELVPSENFSIAIWAKNIAGEKYATFAASQAGPTGYPYLPAPPRTYGVTAGFKF